MGDQIMASWNYLPYPVLFNIFEYLNYTDMITAGLTCKSWQVASMDDLLWKKRFFENFIAYRSTPLIPGSKKFLIALTT